MKAGSAAYFNPVQVDLQWIRRVQKEERTIMDTMADGGASAGRGEKVVDDVYQHFGSAYFYQSEYLKNHMYINGGPPGGLGAPFVDASSRLAGRCHRFPSLYPFPILRTIEEVFAIYGHLLYSPETHYFPEYKLFRKTLSEIYFTMASFLNSWLFLKITSLFQKYLFPL